MSHDTIALTYECATARPAALVGNNKPRRRRRADENGTGSSLDVDVGQNWVNIMWVLQWIVS